MVASGSSFALDERRSEWRRYAYFPNQRRLAIERGGSVELYDTGEHLIGGVSQQQGGTDSLAFTSQRGPVQLEALRRVRQETAAAPNVTNVEPPATAGPSWHAETSPASDKVHSVLEIIEKLAALHERGVLTDGEFNEKKTELLGRL